MSVDMIAIGDGFIWVTSVIGGAAAIGTVYQAIGRAIAGPRLKAMLGTWYGYAYFQTHNGPRFYKEICVIRRDRWLPWRLSLSSCPVGGTGATRYAGAVSFDPPFVYISGFEPVYGDRTSEIYRWQMSERHEASLLIGIHLGRTYEETIHNATPMVMCRSELDPNASESQKADANVERAEFEQIVRRHFTLETSSLQLLFS